MKAGTWLLVAGAMALGHAPANAEIKNWDKTFEVGAMPVVRVQAGDARVTVHAGPAGKVEAHVRREFRHWGFVGSSKSPEVTLEQVGGEVRVLVKDASWVVAIGAVSDRMEVNLIVPDSCDLRVRSSDGAVQVTGPLSGRFDLAANDGRLIVDACHGDLTLSTSDGAILASNLDGRVQATSSDGRVEIDGRFDMLNAKASDGRMRVLARTGSRMVGPWSVETHDSALEMLIPRDLKADLDANTGDGRIRFNLPVPAPASIKDGELVGRLNGGGPVLRVRTNDGSLTLGVSD